MLIGEPVTFESPGEPTGALDEQGNPVLGSPVLTVVPGWAVQPVTPEEDTASFGVAPVDGVLLFARSIVQVRSDGYVMVRGERFAVRQVAASWRSPYGTNQVGTVVAAERVA